MVWKFNTAAAQEKHAERVGHHEPGTTNNAPETANAQVEPDFSVPAAVLDDHISRIGTSGHGNPPRAEQVANPFDLLEGDVIRVEPDLHFYAEPEPQGSAVEPQSVEATDQGIPVLTSAVDDIPVLTVELEEIPSGDLTWNIPAFEGSVDELPDLRPIPPAPEEHPGLQYRTANNFGHALRFPHDDSRQALWAEQRRDRGFDDTELWGLDDAFARFILPRLKALRQQKLTPPTRMELVVWYSMLDKMIRAFELLLPEGGGAWDRGKLNDKERAQVQEGLDHFRQYYFSLCW
jgi:hypothetical protein